MSISIETYKRKISSLESSVPGISKNFRFFLKKSLNYSDLNIILENEINISEAEVKKIEDFISLSRNKTPIEYILNDSEFYGRSFYVDSRVLIPRDETELIVDLVKEYSASNNPKIADLGTGSGCIGISLAIEITGSLVIGIDSSLDALEVANRNKNLHKTSNFEPRKSNWLEGIKDNDFDFIVSNPPYISSSDEHLKDLIHEPKKALISSENGYSDFKKISTQAYKKLKKGGILIFEHGYNQANKVNEIMQSNYFNQIKNFKDYQGHPRITIGIK